MGAKKPQEKQKSKSPLEMRASKDVGKEHYDPTREVGIKGRNETRSALWEEHFLDPIVALDKAPKCVKVQY